MKKNILVILIAILFNFNAIASNKNFDIVAIVGDDAISTIDVEKRLELTISSSGMKNDEETKERLFPQIVKTLIDESLYIEEAKKLRIEATSQDLKTAVMNLEKQNGLKYGTFDDFLRSKNIPVEATKEQLKSQIIWSKLVNQKIRPKIIITDLELNEKLEHISNSAGISELNISEILLPVDNPEDAKRVKSLADKLVKEISEGIEFSAIAKEFSHSTTASTGGDLGWIREEHAPKEIISKVRHLQVGEVSEPFYVSGSYYIVKLNDRRALVTDNNANSTVSIRQAFVRTKENIPQSVRTEIAANIEEHMAGFKSCKEFPSFARKINSAIKSDVVVASMNDINPEIRNIISQTPVNKLTHVMTALDGFHVFAVCARSKPEQSIVLKEKVKTMILRRKIDLQAQRYLRDLRSKAFIEIRA